MFNSKYIFKWGIFQCHASFEGCIVKYNEVPHLSDESLESYCFQLAILEKKSGKSEYTGSSDLKTLSSFVLYKGDEILLSYVGNYHKPL